MGLALLVERVAALPGAAWHASAGIERGRLRSEHHQTGPIAPMAQLGMLSHWSGDQRSLLQVTHMEP